ncbi:ABC transporter permease [Polyangium sp. y55x31]|uniref:ABC transporter permease n=1 Tax=Polyangium sp. y55x31 TaxID=3042688 RepID=UPI00248250ED|nr:ABC transporter permease [Polyangium sp. y55x31]
MMHRIALSTLLHERGKFAGSVAGVAFASTLALVEAGLYQGFTRAASSVITAAGGDLWVMERGTKVLDDGPILPGSTRALLSSHPCVSRVRALGFRYVAARPSDGSEAPVILVGFEPDTTHLLPWNIQRGLPDDLHGPLRVSVDVSDLPRLSLPANPIGATLRLGGHASTIAVVTHRIRSFSLAPYVFGEMDTFRRLTKAGPDEANYWLADLTTPQCTSDVVAFVQRHPRLKALRRQAFAGMTEHYWVWGSGAGPILLFSMLLGIVVGALIVAQTLRSLARDHFKELATMRALGATKREVLSFVGWQMALLGGLGMALGGLLALGLGHLAGALGLAVVLSPPVLALGAAAVLGICLLSSLGSFRAVARIEPAEVFR